MTIYTSSTWRDSGISSPAQPPYQNAPNHPNQTPYLPSSRVSRRPLGSPPMIFTDEAAIFLRMKAVTGVAGLLNRRITLTSPMLVTFSENTYSHSLRGSITQCDLYLPHIPRCARTQSSFMWGCKEVYTPTYPNFLTAITAQQTTTPDDSQYVHPTTILLAAKINELTLYPW